MTSRISKKKIWIIDIIAFVGFLLTFKPQITGYTFHEWLGLAVGFTLLLHLLQHWRWVKSICRTLNCAKTKLLIRFFLDGVYFGQAAIPAVETWRGRDFTASIQVELQNLQNNSFAFQMGDFKLGRQENAVNDE